MTNLKVKNILLISALTAALLVAYAIYVVTCAPSRLTVALAEDAAPSDSIATEAECAELFDQETMAKVVEILENNEGQAIDSASLTELEALGLDQETIDNLTSMYTAYPPPTVTELPADSADSPTASGQTTTPTMPDSELPLVLPIAVLLAIIALTGGALHIKHSRS